MRTPQEILVRNSRLNSKPISPRVHSWLDVGVTGYFLALAALFWRRDRKRASALAMINAGMVAGVSALTDYDGDGVRPISFPTHGVFDMIQGATAAIGPVAMGFATEPEAKYFYGQAANEGMVIQMTDWHASDRQERRLAA